VTLNVGDKEVARGRIVLSRTEGSAA